MKGSGGLYETVDHPLLTRLVELYSELVAVDLSHFAIAKFLVKDPLSEHEGSASLG